MVIKNTLSITYLIVILISCIFVSEALVMLFIAMLPPLSQGQEILIDSTVLSIFIFPIVYSLVFRPLKTQLAQQRQTDEKLRIAAVAFESQEPMVITDADTYIIQINQAFAESTGYTKQDVAGLKINILKSGQHDEAFYVAMWDSLLNHGFWQGEIWDRRKNGEIYPKWLSITAVKNNDGIVTHYVGIHTDITEHKRREEEIKQLGDSELNKAKLEAERANQAKSDFLSSMSHELRTPMNAVLGFAQLLELEDLNEEQLDNVREILTAGHHLMHLINEVLDLSKIESGKIDINLEKIDLATFIKSCVSLIQPLTLKNRIKISNEINSGTVFADVMLLKQVLLNLISNAIKYNKVEGCVTLSSEVITPQTLKIKVTDTGNGLSELQLAKLFQPFERLKAKNSNIEGSGIGLCICKQLVETMNGRIGVTSTVGKGCCFWIELPLA